MKRENAGWLLALGILLIPVEIFISGFVITKLWAWFIVPVFNLPSLSILTGYGIAITVRFLSGAEGSPASDDNWEVVVQFLKALISPLVYLGFAWLVTLFM